MHPYPARFLSRQSRGSWSDSNMWVAVVFAALATLLKLYLDTRTWTLSIETNKTHAFAYGGLYMLSVVAMIVAGFLIAA
jgi:hypothetical protein